MNLQETEYRIKLNMLRIKYSKNPIQTISLLIDSALTVSQFEKEYRNSKQLSKFEKGGILRIDNNK
jgi:hypothetical protein